MTWVFALTSYSSVAKATFTMLACRTSHDDRLVLARIGDIECYTGWFQIFSFVVLLPLVLAFPLLVLRVARKAPRQSAAAEATRLAYGNHASWFESAMMWRRLLLILPATFIYDPVTRAFVLLSCCCALLVLHIYLQPFAASLANRVETLMLTLLVMLSALLTADSQVLAIGAVTKAQTASTLQGVLLIVAFLVALWFALDSAAAKLCSVLRNRPVAPLEDGLASPQQTQALLLHPAEPAPLVYHRLGNGIEAADEEENRNGTESKRQGANNA